MIRLLLVDDHAVMRDGLKTLLEQHPDIAVVGETDTGEAAVALAGKRAPDVVLMDISLPRMSGIEATREIAARPGRRPRVVVLTMHSSAEHVFRARRAGATGYLLKESSGDEVVAAIRAAHRGTGYLSASLGLTDDDLEHASPMEGLSEREREVLQRVVEGYSSHEIAASTGISPKTVETYRSRIADKLGIGSVAGLVLYALEHGLAALPAGVTGAASFAPPPASRSPERAISP